jgi:hypothetical protein
MSKLDSLHCFERHGLGKAPFSVVGYGKEIFQAVPGDSRCPIQPGAVCAYCGQGIMYVAYIQSSDGKRFKVGCDCVNKTGDWGLVKGIKNNPEYRAMSRAKAKARDERVTEELNNLLANPDVLATLSKSNEAHPEKVKWALKWSGASGRARWLKKIKQGLAELETQ